MLRQVNSDNAADNCRKEFLMASLTLPGKMIPVPMEASVEAPREWGGIVKMHLGGLLYPVSLADDQDWDVKAKLVAHEICRLIATQEPLPS